MGQLPPQLMPFRNLVGTFGILSVHDCEPTNKAIKATDKLSEVPTKIKKAIAVLECENAKNSKLARSARSHIYIDFSQS